MTINSDLLLSIFKDHHDILLGLFGTPIIKNQLNNAEAAILDLILVLQDEMKSSLKKDQVKLDEQRKYLWELRHYNSVEDDLYTYSDWLKGIEASLKNFTANKQEIEKSRDPIHFILSLNHFSPLRSAVNQYFEINDEQTKLTLFTPSNFDTFYMPNDPDADVLRSLFIYNALEPKYLADADVKLSNLITLNNQLVPLLRKKQTKYNQMDSILNHNGLRNSGVHLNLAIKRYVDSQLYPPISLSEFQYLRDTLISRLRQIAPNFGYFWVLKNEACKGLNLHLLLSNERLKKETDVIWGELTKGRGVICDMTPFNQSFRGYSISLLALCFLAPMFESTLPNAIGCKVRTYATNKK